MILFLFQASLAKQITEEREIERAFYSKMCGGKTTTTQSNKKLAVSDETYQEIVIILILTSGRSNYPLCAEFFKLNY